MEVGTGTNRTRFIKTDWPNEEGLELGSTKIDNREFMLTPEDSNVLSKEKVGL